MKLSPHLIATTIAAVYALSASAQTPSTPVPTPGPKPTHSPRQVENISRAVGINELKIEMAETRLKLYADPKIVSDLASALEEYLTTTCMPKLLQTLSYAGKPSDPICIERTRRLLQINPGNPVAVCVQEGIASKPCIDAFQNQKIVVVYPSQGDHIDPALRVGLSAATLDRIAKVEGSLEEINTKYQRAETPDEKRALLNDASTLYDQILNMSCKVSAVGLVPESAGVESAEPAEITQTRERLLQIPPAIRGDYQREMAAKAQKEFDDPKTTPERASQLKDLLAVIKDPSGLSPHQTANLKRARYILSKCSESLTLAAKVVPDLPSVTCFHQGWYTPQCIYALKKWRIQKQQETTKGNAASSSPSSKPSMISTF